MRAALLLALAAAGCASDDDAPRPAEATPPGFWYESAAPHGGRALDGLGYASGYTEDDGLPTGARVLDADRVAPGYNLYSAGHAAAATLIDATGATVHEWAFPYAELPGAPPLDHTSQIGWRRVRLLPDGSLLALHDGILALKVDRDSNLVWWYGDRAHHDLDVAPDGRIALLTRRITDVPEVTRDAPLLDEAVTFLSPDGEELDTIRLVEAFRGTPWQDVLPEAAAAGRVAIEIDGRSALDLFHANSIRVLDGAWADRHPAFAAGNVLLCLRELNVLCVLDTEARRIAWLQAGDWLAPHDPRPTAAGTLTLFDNRGAPLGRSRVLEFDPFAGTKVWSFPRQGGVVLDSPVCGAARRLSNGNTLVTESTGGRALEVAPDGDVVWAFRSPHRTEDGWVAVLFEVERIPEHSVAPWLPSRDTGPEGAGAGDRSGSVDSSRDG